MRTIDKITHGAGFRKAGKISTNNIDTEQTFGMDIVPSEIMPEGWLGLRTERGCLCLAPSGKTIWVPAFNPYTPFNPEQGEE